MICILKSILGYVVLMFVGTNLLGFVVRGIVPTNYKDDEGVVWLVEDLRKPKSILTTILGILVVLAYFYALSHYWNIDVVIAAAMLMLSRLPDLLYEMKTGVKISFKNMPNKFKYIFWNMVGWVTLPILWYAMCMMK